MCVGIGRTVIRLLPGLLSLRPDGTGETASPYPCLDKQRTRYCNGLAVEYGRHHLAAAPFYLLLVVGNALPGGQHVVDDDNLFSLDIPCDAVVPFEDTVLLPFGFMQAFSWLEHIDIVQPRRQFRAVGTDIPVQTLEPPEIFYIRTARHEHDMIGLAVRLQGFHASLEKLDAVYFPLLELIDGTAERPLLVIN